MQVFTSATTVATEDDEELLREEERVLQEAISLLETLHTSSSPAGKTLDALHHDVRRLQASTWALKQEVRPSPDVGDGIMPDELGDSSVKVPTKPLDSIAVGASSSLGGAFTWGTAEASSFPVRIGPHYKKHGKKSPSKETLYELRGVDVVTNGNDGHSGVEHVARNLDFEFTEDQTGAKSTHKDREAGGAHPRKPHADGWEERVRQTGLPRIFICNAMVPPRGGHKAQAGTSSQAMSFVFTFEVRESTIEAAEAIERGDGAQLNDESLVASIGLVTQFAKTWHSDNAIRKRFKVIGFVNNFDEVKVSGLGLFKSFNGKPVIIFKTGEIHQQSDGDYLEMNVNMFKFGYLSRRAFDAFRDRLPDFSFRGAFVIQGDSDNELPERLIGTFSLSNADSSKAVPLAMGPSLSGE